MINRFIRAALVAVLAITGIGVAASPAMADTFCPASSYICLWTSPNYAGDKTATNVRVCQNMPGASDNAATAIKVSASPTSNDWIVYVDYNCSTAGGFLTVNNGTNIADLAAAFDNKISSIGPS